MTIKVNNFNKGVYIMAEKIINENVNENELISNESVVNEEVNEAKVENKPLVTLDEFKKNAKFTKYIGNYAQRMIIDTVKDDCIYEKDGMYYIDYLRFDISFNLAIVSFYTDFVLDDVNNYDHLDSIGIFEYIMDKCEETYHLYNIIDKELKQKVSVLNSVGAVITRALNGFINNIPDITELKSVLNDLPNVLNSVDPSVLQIFSKEFSNGTIQNQVIGKDKDKNKDKSKDDKKVYGIDEIKKILEANKNK